MPTERRRLGRASTPWGAVGLVAAALASMFAPTRSAHAEATELSEAERKAAARSLFQEGVKAQDAGRHAEALVLFSKAQKLYDAPTHLLHIAECQALTGKLVEAAETYETLKRVPLAPGAPDVFVEAKRRAEQDLPALRARIPSLRIDVSPRPEGFSRFSSSSTECASRSSSSGWPAPSIRARPSSRPRPTGSSPRALRSWSRRKRRAPWGSRSSPTLARPSARRSLRAPAATVRPVSGTCALRTALPPGAAFASAFPSAGATDVEHGLRLGGTRRLPRAALVVPRRHLGERVHARRGRPRALREGHRGRGHLRRRKYRRGGDRAGSRAHRVLHSPEKTAFTLSALAGGRSVGRGVGGGGAFGGSIGFTIPIAGRFRLDPRLDLTATSVGDTLLPILFLGLGFAYDKSFPPALEAPQR
jgi:hypothetical protein